MYLLQMFFFRTITYNRTMLELKLRFGLNYLWTYPYNRTMLELKLLRVYIISGSATYNHYNA